MPNHAIFKAIPSKSASKLLASFCLMSLIPTLIGLYIASIFIKFPFEITSQNLIIVSVVIFLSLVLSYLGFFITKQMVSPMAEVSAVAQRIAQGNLEEPKELTGTDEIEELTHSLRTISHNARELLDKVDKLSQKDKVTGLYNGSYLRERLNEEIQRAIHYQRPCSFAFLSIDRFDALTAMHGTAAADALLKAIAGVFNAELSEFDRAARITQGEFGIIFFDKNKRKAIELAEKIRSSIHQSSLGALKLGEFTVSIGISENPLDGTTAQDLYSKAQNRVAVSRQKSDQKIAAFD